VYKEHEYWIFNIYASFNILLTMHHVMILGKRPTWRTNSFLRIYFIYNSLHVSRTSCSSSGETNCINTASGNCHSVWVAVSYWYNLSLLMMSTMCSKHVESY